VPGRRIPSRFAGHEESRVAGPVEEVRWIGTDKSGLWSNEQTAGKVAIAPKLHGLFSFPVSQAAGSFKRFNTLEINYFSSSKCWVHKHLSTR